MTDETTNDDIQHVADEILADSDYDTELGKRMAADARRVADGSMSRSAFEEAYAEDVAAEFDLDITDPEAGDQMPGVISTPESVSRRTVLKATGAATGAAALGAAGTTETAKAQSEGGNAVKLGMVIDTESCIKCLACVEACKAENHTPEGTFWMQVYRYQREDREYEDPTDCESLPRPCQHCDDAPCVEVCPNNSRFKTENGRVVCNYETCLGCKYCEVACPNHVNSFASTEPPEDLGRYDGQRRDEKGRWVAGTPPIGASNKCSFCVQREWDPEKRGTTACEEACPADAIHFGDLNDPESDPNTYLQDYDDSDTFKVRNEVTDSNVIYIGEEPEDVELESVPGPWTHEKLGLEEPETGE